MNDLLNEKLPDPSMGWKDVSPGGTITGGATAVRFKTGDWRVDRPSWDSDACRQCLMCVPVCPDSSISVQGGVRNDFNYYHCKGCGICAEVCPFQAIAMIKER